MSENSDSGRDKYSALKLKELQNLCKDKGLQVIGRKDVLISRLMEYDAAAHATEEGDTPTLDESKEISSSSPRKISTGVKKSEVAAGNAGQQASKTVISTSADADAAQSPNTSTAEKTEEQRRLERAKRFGTETVEDKKLERALRFGIVSKQTEQAKMKARSERFATTTQESENPDEETVRRLKRAQRFGLVTADTEAEKKRMRSQRFGT